MKVTFVVANYAPSVGGAQVYVQRVAEGLAGTHGHEVDVVTTDAFRRPAAPDAGLVGPPSEVRNGVHVRRLPAARRLHAALRMGRRIGRRLGLIRSDRLATFEVGPLGVRFLSAAVAAGRRSDVVVAVTVPSLTLAAARTASRTSSAACVAAPLLHLTKQALDARSVRSLARAEGCACLTTYERDWLIERGVETGRAAVLPPGCDPDRYQDLTPAAARAALGLPDAPTVGYVGRLAAYKGVGTLLDALPAVWGAHPDTTVLLAGNHTGWDDFDRLVEEVEPLASGRLVVRPGFTDDERSLLLAACDVVAFPSSEESFGMVTIEAWCARRPVVAADIPAVRCLIRPGIDGELVPVGDDVALADAIGGLLSDPAKRERLGDAGRARAEAEFGWEGIIEQWNTHLADAVARRRHDVEARGAMRDER
jgi:glycosyltransferase involved in cell wall biosynthesis